MVGGLGGRECSRTPLGSCRLEASWSELPQFCSLPFLRRGRAQPLPLAFLICRLASDRVRFFYPPVDITWAVLLGASGKKTAAGRALRERAWRSREDTWGQKRVVEV